MFCKFCGRDIPDTSEFCPECGKKLKKEERKEEEARQATCAPLVLMLIMLCWSTVFTWGRILLFGDRCYIGMLISTVMLVAGLVLLGTMIGRGRIHAENYRFSDLLVLGCVWMVVPGLMANKMYEVVYYFVGSDEYYAWFCWKTYMVQGIQFPAFWLILGLIVLGLARSGNWKPTKKHSRILLVVLALRSAVGFVFTRQVAIGMSAPGDAIDMMVNMTRQWTLLCWLWPLVILKVFRALGEGRIKIGVAVASLLGMQLGEMLLLPIVMAGPQLGAGGGALANGLAPLFGLLILHLATRLHKKKSAELK